MAPANKRMRIEDEDEEFSDIQLNECEFQQKLKGLIEFLELLKVSKFAREKLKETEEKYQLEIEERENAKNMIKSPKPLNLRYISQNPELKKRVLWSHIIPTDILKKIFTDCIFDLNVYDLTVINLMLVCKNWRKIILENESDQRFTEILWYPLLSKFNYDFDWKHLVLIPDKYLKLMINIHPRDMTMNECKHYRSLIHDNYNPNDDEMWTKDTNIPLLIAIIHKCPRLYSIELFGELCVDLFFEIGDKLKELQHLSFIFTKNANSNWFHHFIYPNSKIIESLKQINIERSYWITDEAFFYFGHCKNLRCITAEKPWISYDGILEIFKGCKHLIQIEIFGAQYFEEDDGDLSEAFKELTENNKEIRYIEIDECGGFNDECLEYLMRDNCCPQLSELTIDYHSCTQRKIREFQRKRPNLKTHLDENDQII